MAGTKYRGPTIAIDREIYDNISERAGAKKVKIVTEANEILSLFLMKEQFLQKWAPHLHLYKTGESSLSIIDDNSKRIIEIDLKDNRVWCDTCDKDNCMHCYFAMACFEIAYLKDSKIKNSKSNK